MTTPTAGPIRLMLRDCDTASSGAIDGAWWPRTDQPMTEIHQLVGAVAPRIGQLARLGFDWTDEASESARIMHLVGSNDATLALLVVPANADPAAARSQMRWAAGKPRIQDPAPAEVAALGPHSLVDVS
ncbi:DUF5994 family protein [Nocardia camponoti]|uniref:Uncharacterized protein n=1 Tax=Nocardia camponoti TaxID=1616106 RepID=A0A917QV85_9NOCA|nr:DUF5994 family protein [Nocardia camponoti]GGK69694.1 hypothetical protein GCM10011591_47310 [Nocardia camponoti]